MSDRWPFVQLGDIATIEMGQSPGGESCSRAGEGAPLLNGPTEFGLRHPTPAQWTTAPTKWAEPGDVLFCVRGSTTGRMNRADQRYVIGRGIAALRGEEDIDTNIVHYLLDLHLPELLARTTGSTFPNISRGTLSSLLVTWPDRNTRRRIASVLGTLDDLIDTNRALANRSQSLAAALASRSPDRVPLGEFASVADVRQFRPDGLVDHFSIPAFDEGQLPERCEGESIKSAKLLLAEPTVLVSRLNPQTQRIWMAYPNDVAAVASTEFVPLIGAGSASVEEVWAVCATDEFATQMMARVTGTTGSHQRVDKAAIPQLLVADACKLNRPAREAIISLVQEANASLVSANEAMRVRDELLPLLLSGQVLVQDVAA